VHEPTAHSPVVVIGAGQAGLSVAYFLRRLGLDPGNDFVVLGALYPHGLHGFISPQDAPVASAEDLAGKRIGGSQGVQPKFDAIFELNGLDPKDYTFVPSGFGPELVINGDVDVQSVFVTDEVLAYKRATGEDPVLFTWDDAGLPSYTLVLFTTRDYLEDHRDALKGFLAAAQRGFDENVADPEAGPRLVADVYGVDAGLTFEDEVAKNAEYLKYVSSEGTEEHGWMWVDPERVGGPIYQGMRAAGLATPPVEDVIDSSLIEELKSAP